jgi:hypothetical protein
MVTLETRDKSPVSSAPRNFSEKDYFPPFFPQKLKRVGK